MKAEIRPKAAAWVGVVAVKSLERGKFEKFKVVPSQALAAGCGDTGEGVTT